MLTKKKEGFMKQRTIDGLAVIYDGKRNYVLYKDMKKMYEPGAMICEYLRFSPYSLKETIDNVPHFYDELNKANLDEAVCWLNDVVFENYPLVVAGMIIGEIVDGLNRDYRNKIDAEKSNESTVGEIIIDLYDMFIQSYSQFEDAFKRYLENKCEEDIKKFPWQLYGDYSHYQNISFKIIRDEDKFQSVYTFYSSMSLLLFEIAHVIDNNSSIVKCQNCGFYFVPETRVDTLYCSYESPQKPGKTCRNVGAQIARADKEKNDVVTKEYRKIYMRYVMHNNRHPDDEEKQKMFEKLTTEIKMMRNKLAHHEITIDDFFEWLDQF